jgi:cytochrome c-type biogenesis protein
VKNVSFYAAFAAGIISFVSPCVLPIVPGYLSFISGVSMQDLKREEDADRRRRLARQVAARSVFFVLGFSVVFVALGASATYVGQWFAVNRSLFGKIAGVVIVVFGLHAMGLTPIKWLNYEKRVQARQQPLGMAGAFLVGLAFAFGWSPCIGPILAGVLALAATQETVSRGVSLLAIYSLGLGVPFVASALAINPFLGFFGRIKRHMKAVEVTAGALLVAVGVLVMTDRLQALSIYLIRWFPQLATLG